MRVDFTNFGVEPPDQGKTGRAAQTGNSGSGASSGIKGSTSSSASSELLRAWTKPASRSIRRGCSRCKLRSWRSLRFARRRSDRCNRRLARVNIRFLPARSPMRWSAELSSGSPGLAPVAEVISYGPVNHERDRSFAAARDREARPGARRDAAPQASGGAARKHNRRSGSRMSQEQDPDTPKHTLDDLA